MSNPGRSRPRQRTKGFGLEQLEGRQLMTSGWYDLGTPTVVDLWVNPTGGNDANSGTASNQAFRTLGAAWATTGVGLDQHGYRINLLPELYPFGTIAYNYLDARHGTFEHPIIIQAAGGPGTVTIQGGLNVNDVGYFALLNVSLVDTPGGDRWGNNVLHIAAADHVLMRGVTVAGPSHLAFPGNFDIQEVVKLNQVTNAFMEGCDISGSYQTGVDFVACQTGHIYDNLIHDTGDWGMYLKGGSAYYQVEGNHFDNTRLGFQAGEGTTFNLMIAPFIHYEAYDIKFVNNLLTNIPGTTISVAGGYNILLANNTMYHVAYYSDEASGGSQGYSPITVVHGSRDCSATTEVPNAEQICSAFVAEGGWGPTHNGDPGADIIPSRNVWVMNNVVDNPDGSASRYSHFVVADPITPPPGTGIPNPSRSDDGLLIQGNVIWNGAADLPLGINDPGGRITASNAINRFAPQFVDPTHGDFHPLAGGNLSSFPGVPIPNFSWADAPARPAIPVGNLSNLVAFDRGGNLRTTISPPGAFATTRDSTTPPPIGRVGSPTLAESARILDHGTTYLSNWVAGWYVSDLGRTPSAGEVAPYVGLLRSGHAPSAVRALLIGSPEFLAGHGGASGWVDAMYQSLLGRAADPSGRTAFENALGQGAGRVRIASQVGSSVEARLDEVVRLYQRFLGRTPKPGEAAGWVEAVSTTSGVLDTITAMVGSPEFLAIHPGGFDTQLTALGADLFEGISTPLGGADGLSADLASVATQVLAASESRSRQVVLAYQHFLGRTPATSEVTPYLVFLNNGGTLEQISGLLAGSAEYVATHGGDVNWVNSIYQDLLVRNADPTGASAIAAALASGVPRTTLATFVATSGESRGLQVGSLYRRLLGREATPDEITPWVNQIVIGTSLNTIEWTFIGSAEYAIRRGGTASARVASLATDLWSV